MNIPILDNGQHHTQEGAPPGTPLKTTSVDVDRYQELLDAPDLSDEEKQNLLQALWTIIVSLVELGYQVHPLQMPSKENPPTKR
ncbi:hypothetical protein [Leisingera aquimarina]|uniref:hypothetical protein n=1 Tax=Leisingera aquimarina TaxID=476529 RepID=UPI0012EC1AC7|nr:hypothetical protein [Leisingera aquimarina]